MQGRSKLILCSSGLCLMVAQCPGFLGSLAWADSAHDTAAVYVSDGALVDANQYDEDDGTVVLSVANGAQGVDGTEADGLLMTSSEYEATGIVVSDGEYQIGGNEEYYSVYSDISNDYVGTTVQTLDPKKGGYGAYNPSKLGDFNTVLLFTLDSDVSEDATTGSSGIDADNDAVVYIDNTYIQVDGAQRYGDSSYNSSTTVVNDSYFVTTGMAAGYTDDISVAASNAALLISGSARTNFSIGASQTYYFNSTVIAEGWAALSTDSATDDGLDLYAYNTTAKALNGGYGTYADTNCRVWLYGSTLEAAEIGAIASKTGAIHVLDGMSVDDDILAYDKGKRTMAGTVLAGGRNAVMLHAPDMMGEGLSAASCASLDVYKSTLETRTDLVSTYDYSSYSDAIEDYIEYVSGDAILVRSTSATITLDQAVVKPYNGVILHTVLNSDSMGNFLAAGDNDSVDPVSLTMTDMQAKGDILHNDYQRNMEVVLSDAALEGKIVQGTYDDWNTIWEDQGVTEANWLPDASWDGENSLSVTMEGKASWTVTGTSTMTSLAIGENALITGVKGQNVVMTVDDVQTDMVPGTTYTGTIVLSLVPAPQKPQQPQKMQTPVPQQGSMPSAMQRMPAQVANR